LKLGSPRISEEEKLVKLVAHWQNHPVDFVRQALNVQPDPWQCDVLDAIAEYDNVAIKSCRGAGKSSLLAWSIIWFTVTRAMAQTPTTAPTYNKQVKDVLWGTYVHQWWQEAEKCVPWLTKDYTLLKTRLQNNEYPTRWFAIGLASSKSINIEGYRAPHLLAVFDEAKGIMRSTWESVQGMRTTQDAKFLVASTPGAISGDYSYFHKVFTKLRETWPCTFSIHPKQLQGHLNRPEAKPHSKSGTYYSSRVRDQWLLDMESEWGGRDSPAFIMHAIGDFSTGAGDALIPWSWYLEAENKEDGAEGDITVVACDVSRYGRDRTVILVGRGGTLLAGESIAKTIEESTPAPEIREYGIGDDPSKPRFKASDVTANMLLRLSREHGASAIVIDDTGLGAGATDCLNILKKSGERVIPLNFGARPTDRPRDAEEAASRERRHLLDSRFSDIKSQMGFALRAAFESRLLALGRLPDKILDPLGAQISMVKQQLDAKGRLKVVDPNDRDDTSDSIGNTEGKKSPDHFHALLLYWWVAGGASRALIPKAGSALPEGLARIGERRAAMAGAQTSRAAAGMVAGQAAHVQRWYR
jgi:hypothetical protein